MKPLRGTGVALALAAVLSTLAAPASAGPQERAAGVRPAAASDEGGLWDLSDKAEAKAKISGELIDDPALNAYVREVACKVAAGHCGDVRVYLMNRPFFNASMAPNGYMEVWSGALLRVGDEAELAFLLGHEATHFTSNHSIESFRALKTRANAAMALQIGLALAGTAAAVNNPGSAQSIIDLTSGLADVVYLGAVASFFAFSRDQEREADLTGADLAVKAGYRADAGASLWRALIAETAASDFPKVRRSATRGGIFDSHPVDTARQASLQSFGAARTAGGDDGRARYRAAVRPHLGVWLRDDLRRRDYGQTLHLIARLAEGGEDAGLLEFYRGEAFRLRRLEGDLERARAAYAAASAHADAPVAVWRELGDLHRRSGDRAAASDAYDRYLTLAPEAEDAWLVRDSLSALKKDKDS